ncbi:alanine--tRNA ligase [Acidovorax carolinensis]|uniref:Alanine--tRNA ligase n=1 Tax=Acidovorax carolinensis TaxID=553814 RepID=A0A240UIJ4_9BURK|nr:alanine--tRNA ligase [Acidovorax carolinensis]ART55048.1 alanine--tRNA ligase [Acidovorax carolinensis]ART60872.1 alanine--tRNA ligase [Acidovorax carolinensis]
MTPTFTVADIRKTFLDFFASKGHTIVASSPLVPGNDPTLMFTNSGMVQFKDVFLGTDKRPYNRAVSVQACLRAGGKHNDLENVGYTARHHTFFEMLGNWSFGDYFKRESLKWAWELLTEVYKLPADRLLATVYQEDDEAYDIWTKEIGLPPERVIRIGDNKGGRYKSDNFWMMADTGPCGPCSEIFYDHGDHIPGGPPGSPDEDGDRFIEIWNNVFMQFNMDETGAVTPLPAPCVDTGMGLERLAAILQHVHSNYEIDLFDALIKAAARETGETDLNHKSLRVIADHIRATAFLVSDGVIPSNEGRGYVQRRIVRRAIRHGYKLGKKTPFFHKLVADLVRVMGDAYPSLRAQEQRITEVLKTEEERFFETLANGMEILDAALDGGAKVLPGDVAFKLHDTYGFPLDLTNDVCRERDVEVDEAGFKTAMEKQKAQARAAGKFKMDKALEYTGAANQFTGYEHLAETAKIVAIYVDGTSAAALKAGQNGVVVLDTTPFYAESGGQVGDEGVITSGSARFAVGDTLKIKADVFGHHGTLEEGTLNVGDTVQAQVNTAVRAATMRNHSVTHIMHKALREVLGSHVQQKGSLVNAERTRFDFAHNAAVTDAEIREIERRVNEEILANQPTQARVMDIESAQKTGAMMLFGEKYGETVRVLDIGTSRELCGGTHVQRTGDIGLFKVVGEGGVAAGIRRIEAVTGANALAYLQNLEDTVNQAASTLKAPVAELNTRIAQALENARTLEKEVAALKGKLASAQGDELLTQAVEVKGLKVLAVVLPGADAKTLRDTMDKLKDKLKTAAIVLAAVDGDKVQIAAGVTADSVGRIKAGELVNFVASQVGGKGGGKPDMAMAGGTDASKLPAALASVTGWVTQQL